MFKRMSRELENRLVQGGALGGLPHEVIVRQGNVWDELDKIIDQDRSNWSSSVRTLDEG
ncbi:MAG TPA: hypothetical protein VEI01_22555 [Terriglobales bacterium]|nr:hypothetical protein [Terriglobales bacterium]HXY52245.1 hypothetical protein [Terriglobales bacterium]